MGFSRQEYWSGLPFPSPVDHILSDLSPMTCPSWVAPFWAWLSFIELNKALVHVIRLASCPWLQFQSVCPLIPSLNAYRLTWISLTLDAESLFMAASAKWNRCSLTRAQGSSSGAAVMHRHSCCTRAVFVIMYLKKLRLKNVTGQKEKDKYHLRSLTSGI